ncbi:MAG: flagellar hook-associated protein FlgK [Pseudomonadota bacterium]
MSLSTALNTAKTGLFSAQKQVAGASENIANANTAGYVKKDAQVSSLSSDGFGVGVTSDIVRTQVDSILLRDLRLEVANLATYDVRALSASRVGDVIGTPADERSLAAAFTDLENQLQALSGSPESEIYQREVLYAAENLVQRFSDSEEAIQSARLEADAKIAEGVDIVNDALSSIEELNATIVAATAAGKDVSGLLDEQDRQIDAIAEQIGIRTFTRGDGQLVITTTEGVTLLDGEARELQFTQSATITAATPLASLSGLTVDGFDIAPTPPGGTQDLRTGAIAGYFLARDTDLVQYQEQIDALAKETVVMFQQADASLAAAPPAPPFTGSLFVDGAGDGVDPAEVAANIVGLAGTIQINPLIDPDAGGDTSLIRDGVLGPAQADGYSDQVFAFLEGLFTKRTFNPSAGLSDFTTLQDYASEFSSGVLNDRVTFENQADRSRVLFDTLEIRRFNETGVNIDEESERLLELEQAYSANAQVINTISRMFEELLARIAS